MLRLLTAHDLKDDLKNRFRARHSFRLPSCSRALFIMLIVRAWNLEIINGSTFAAESAHNSLEVTTLFAPRGVITDSDGVVLAENVEEADGSTKRFYPMPSLGQIIGYVSYPKKDANGIYYDTDETGVAGIEAAVRFASCREERPIAHRNRRSWAVRSEGTVVPAERRRDTCVFQLMRILKNFLHKRLRTRRAVRNFIAGAGVIIDVNTGAVRAIVSYPTFDPNVMSNGGPCKRYCFIQQKCRESIS